MNDIELDILKTLFTVDAEARGTDENQSKYGDLEQLEGLITDYERDRKVKTLIRIIENLPLDDPYAIKYAECTEKAHDHYGMKGIKTQLRCIELNTNDKIIRRFIKQLLEDIGGS